MLSPDYPIATERLLLRPFAPDDLDGLVAIHADPDVVRYLYWDVRDRDELRGVLEDKAARSLLAKEGDALNLAAVVAETGDVDISKETVLVSIGRGIQDPENVAIAQELADALGGAVSCSRPVVDAKWMEKSRQVGSSGQTVKPKVYLACGISGSFQHLAGIKGSPFIAAINKNPKAPIFRVANVGVVADMLEFLPALTSRIREQ